jgi:hypothetical protein
MLHGTVHGLAEDTHVQTHDRYFLGSFCFAARRARIALW